MPASSLSQTKWSCILSCRNGSLWACVHERYASVIVEKDDLYKKGGKQNKELLQVYSAALERQDLSRTYLVHHELESVVIIIIILIIIIIIIVGKPQPLCHLLVCQLPEQDLKLLRNLHA